MAKVLDQYYDSTLGCMVTRYDNKTRTRKLKKLPCGVKISSKSVRDNRRQGLRIDYQSKPFV